jgi:hydroxymethylglutaryl-CoA reductase (NADPH)
MVCIATEKACDYIMEHTDAEHCYIESNLSSEKKASFFNFITGYGKEVQVEATFSRDVVLKYLGSSPKAIYDQWFNGFLGGVQAGMVGINCHFANAIAAMFMACGQDVAQTVNAGMGTTICESTADGALRLSLKLPNILIGTVGGGTMTGTAKECLEILGCSGPDRARKFAEIIGATLLAGEVSILAALSSGNFAKAHLNRRNASKSGIHA